MARREVQIDNPLRWITQHVAPESLAVDAKSGDGTYRPEEFAHASSAGCGFALRRPFYPSITAAPRKASIRSPRSGPKTQPRHKARAFDLSRFWPQISGPDVHLRARNHLSPVA